LGVEVPLGSSFELSTWGSFRAKQDRLNDPVNLDDNRIPKGGTPGYVTLHARGTYQLHPTLEIFARVDNLTDARVLDHGSGFYGPGFSASVGVSLDTEY
jgi:outer membrane receptor protein involved in Fe transport